MRITPGFVKTGLVIAAGALTLALPIGNRVVPLDPVFYAMALALPLITIVLNPIGRRYFAMPRWSQSPILNHNRLVAAQFGAVFFLVVAICTRGSALLHDTPTSDLAWLAVAFGGGYAISIPIGLWMKRQDDRKQG